MYYNYHAKAKRLIAEGRLVGWYFAARHKAISPALVLVFDDDKHRVMPVREYCWAEYMSVLPAELFCGDKKTLPEK